MKSFMTAEQIAHRTRRAVDAAVHAGRAQRLVVTDARVLYDAFSVVVHLAPAPVVARVPTVLPHYADLDSVSGRQRAELAVTGWLADRGMPVIAPSSARAPGTGAARRLLDDVLGVDRAGPGRSTRLRGELRPHPRAARRPARLSG